MKRTKSVSRFMSEHGVNNSFPKMYTFTNSLHTNSYVTKHWLNMGKICEGSMALKSLKRVIGSKFDWNLQNNKSNTNINHSYIKLTNLLGKSQRGWTENQQSFVNI